MKDDNRSGFHYKRCENISSKVLGMHKKVDTKTLNKLFSDSWPTDYCDRLRFSFCTKIIASVIVPISLLIYHSHISTPVINHKLYH